MKINVHGRSGRVALPRVKVTPARPARLDAEDVEALRAERAAVLRSNVDAIADSDVVEEQLEVCRQTLMEKLGQLFRRHCWCMNRGHRQATTAPVSR
jgi:hypothetical protein